MSPSDAEVTELPSSPGARLRREREARGLSEQQAAETLNLDPSVVAILEANDFAALGAPVFVKGHLRRYASLLELDVDEIVGAYERSKQHIDEPTLVPRARLEMAPVRGRSRWPLVVGGTAAFLIAAGLLAYLSEHGLPWSSQPAADEPVADAPAIEPGGTLPPSAAVGSAPTMGPASDGTATPATPPADVAGAAGSTAAVTTPNVAASPAPGAASATNAPATVAPPAPGQVRLQLRFSGDSWVEIFDGSGKAVVYDLGKTGTERTVTATAPLSVTIGNAPAVAITINGRAIPPPPAPGAVARFSVGADGNLR